MQGTLEELGQTREALKRAREFFQLGDAWVPLETFMKALGRTKVRFLKDDWMLNRAAEDFGLRIIVEADRLLLEGAIPLGEVSLERAGVKEMKSSSSRHEFHPRVIPFTTTVPLHWRCSRKVAS